MSQTLEVESPESLVVPVAVLPVQVAGGTPSNPTPGVRALMIAVLEDAIRCLQAPRRREPAAAREAADWVQSNDLEWPYSFVNVCDALGIAPERLRAALSDGRRRVRYRLHLRAQARQRRLLSATHPVAAAS